MNYMAHLVALTTRRKIKPLTTNAIVLNFILLEFNNEIGWKYEWFTVANSVLKELCGFTNVKALERARNELIQKEYIQYKKGSGNQSGSYFIEKLGQEKSHSMSDNVSGNVSHNMSDNVSCSMSTLYKLKETKLKDKSNTNVLPKESRPRFQKPTVEEISGYCKERGNGIDPNQFYDYYESNGWKVGKNSMKDWKATVRNWETRQDKPQKGVKSDPPRKYTDTSYDLSELEERLINRPLEFD